MSRNALILLTLTLAIITGCQAAEPVPADAKPQKIGAGFKFVEGPTWISADGGGYLVFSDIPANHIKKWSAKDGIGVFRDNSRNSNGNTTDLEGRLVTCEHSGRRVSRTEKDGTIVTLVDSYLGKKLNSPNDVVVKSDGTIWFTDPDYGVPQGQKKEQPGNYVYRYDPKLKVLSVVANDFDKPNGLAFSPDEKMLYIADSGRPHHIRVFDVQSKDGTATLVNGKVHVVIDVGGPDGIRCDEHGNVWSSSGDGVQVISPEGKVLHRVLLPESAANLCFGGADGMTLFMTARTSLYSIKTNVKGAGR